MTIKELKEYIKNLPEEDENGEPFTVWVETEPFLSNQVKEVMRLNVGDIIFILV